MKQINIDGNRPTRHAEESKCLTLLYVILRIGWYITAVLAAFWVDLTTGLFMLGCGLVVFGIADIISNKEE